MTTVYPPGRPLDPLHGTHDPIASTPDRIPGSVRRTTTIEMIRPDGIGRDLTLRGRARDILTNPDGSVKVLDQASMDVVIDFLDAATVTAIATEPGVPALQQVVGHAAATGFRAAVDVAIGSDPLRGGVLYQLLDDIPVATLVSGYAVGFADGAEVAAGEERPWRRPQGMAELQVADLCAGFQAGGTIMKAREQGSRKGGGGVTGPIAPSVERPDDEWAWHDFTPLSPDSMRRRRRIDIHRGASDPTLVEVEAFFRDSHLGEDGYETIIHEYEVTAVVDTTSMTFVDATATPHVLPWWECPQAAASAKRLAGRPLQMLRPAVRSEFLGPTTCTHLNDTLRSLEDVAFLATSLP